MDALLSAIAGALGKTENIALLFSVLVNVGLSWAHIVWRREERADRQAMLITFNSLTAALNDVKVALATLTGKVS